MKTLPRTLWEVLKFEAVCKLLAICLVYPVLNGVFQIYACLLYTSPSPRDCS